VSTVPCLLCRLTTAPVGGPPVRNPARVSPFKPADPSSLAFDCARIFRPRALWGSAISNRSRSPGSGLSKDSRKAWLILNGLESAEGAERNSRYRSPRKDSRGGLNAKSRHLDWACVALAACLAASLAARGVVTGTIAGRITDPDGRPVPRIAVHAANLATQLVYRATSSEAGEYSIAQLAARAGPHMSGQSSLIIAGRPAAATKT
jgi:hypothetical protein